MARILNGHFGSYQGKLGAVTGFKRRGIFYIRQSITHNGSNTKAQALQRKLFSAVSHVFSKFASVAAIGFGKATAPGQTAMNAFVAANYAAVDAVSMEPNFDKVFVARGSYKNVDQPTVANEDPGKITAAWQYDDGDPMISGEDMVYLCLYEPESNTSTLQSVTRQSRELICGYPAPWAGKTARAWIFAVSRLTGKVSDSVALGRVSCE